MDNQTPQQNLIRQVSAERILHPPGFYKSIVFDALTIVSALSFGYLYKLYLGSQVSITGLLIGLGVFSLFSTLEVILSKNFGRRFFVLALETIALLAPFYDYSFSILASAAAALLVFLSWGEVISRRELQNGLEIRFFRATKPFLAKFTTAVALAVLILYVPKWDPKNVFISEGAFRAFFNQTAGFANTFYPEVKFNSSVHDLTESLARLQLTGTSVFVNLSPAVQEQVIKQTSSQIIESLSKSLKISAKGDEPTSSVFYNLSLATLANLYDRFKGKFLAAWFIAAFLIVRGFGTIFYWVSGTATFLIYELLLALDFIRIAGESRTHEVVDFS